MFWLLPGRDTSVPRQVQIAPLVFDANVVLDYWCCEPAIIRAIVQNIAPIFVPDVVADVIGPALQKQWSRRNIKVVNTSSFEIEHLFFQNGTLSRADHACIWLTLTQAGVLVSNDVRLRQEGETHGVKVMWGLEPLARLSQKGHITARSAKQAALLIQSANPIHLSEERIREFLGAVGDP